METRKRLGGADGVRALACLMVMAHHAFQKLALYKQTPEMQDWQNFFLTGAAGVGVFFVLSGYLLASPFWRAWGDDLGRPSLATYALRRWARIAPAFWVNLTLTFVLALTFLPDAPDLVWRYLAGLTFTSSFTWQTFFPVEINGPLWSIGFEVFSYTMLGLFLFLWFLVPGKRTFLRGFGWWVGVLALTLVVHSLLLEYGQTDYEGKGWQWGMTGGAKYWWPSYNPVGFFATFVLGVLAAGVTDALRRRDTKGSGHWLADLVVVGALVGVVSLLWNLRSAPEFSFSWPTQPYYFPTFALLFAAILAVGPHTKVAGRWLDNLVARFLATISFGLYIWHYLFLEGAHLIWPDLQFFGVTDVGDWAVKIGLVYASAAVMATLSWYFFEKPIVAWSHRLGART